MQNGLVWLGAGCLVIGPHRFLNRSEIQSDILVEKPRKRRSRSQHRGRFLRQKAAQDDTSPDVSQF